MGSFILVVIVVAALIGGWLFLADWATKYHTKNIVSKVIFSLVVSVILVLTLIFISSHISGI